MPAGLGRSIGVVDLSTVQLLRLQVVVVKDEQGALVFTFRLSSRRERRGRGMGALVKLMLLKSQPRGNRDSNK